MIKMIDDEPEHSGYGYTNNIGEVETVTIVYNTFCIVSAEGHTLYIYKEDAPKLIKALTLAAKL